MAGLVGPLGIEATVWVIACVYLLGLGLTFWLRQPAPDARSDVEPSAGSVLGTERPIEAAAAAPAGRSAR